MDNMDNKKDEKKNPERKHEQEEKDSNVSAKPVFRTIGLEEEPDQVQYRSMTAVAPPITGLGVNLMHDTPAPLNFETGSKQGFKKVEAAPSFGVRADKTKYVGVSARDLPPPPFRLELHTHFHVRGEAMQRICSIIGRKLCDLDTDFTFNPDKCKWKVEYRHNSGIQRVNLNIIIFKSNKEYVVEVQRREGDITALMSLYSELSTFFARNHLLSEKSQRTARAKRPAPTSVPQFPVSAENIKDAIGAVQGLLQSKYHDSRLQGVLGAISLSATEESRPAMASLVPQLVLLGQSNNQNLARLAGVALSRLCDHQECRKAFIHSEGWQFIVECAAGGSNLNPEVQRESLHVVETLCPLYHIELAQVEGASKVLELVQNWQTIEDPRLKKHACNAHRTLKEAGVIA